MKATARNQFAGRIAAIAKGPASSLVSLDLGEGLLLQASVAGANLGLKKGQQAIALVKASEVVLFADLGGYRLAEDNQFAGTIARVVKGGASAQVVLTLPGGRTISASVTAEAVELLGLAPGQPALACFKPSSVMLAIA